jgi:hypothetical protein
MPRSYDDVAAALMWHDPRNQHWQPRTVAPLPDRVEHQLAVLRHRATLSMRGQSMADTFDRLRHLAQQRAFGTIHDVVIGDRLPLVLAHGPSLGAVVPAIREARDRLFVITPYRTAVYLAAADIWPDVVVLADRGATPYRISDTLWSETAEATRERVGRTCTLVMDPFAPESIWSRFGRRILLEDGTGLSATQAPLPFWGFALLTCLALPLALGASTAAIGGIDLKAAAGRRRSTWDGESVHLDPRFATLVALLETLASCDRTLVDLTGSSIAKRHFRQESIQAYLRRPAARVASGEPRLPAPDAWLSRALTQLLAHLEAQASIVGSIRARAEEGLRVTGTPDSAERRRRIAELLDTIECHWPEDPRFREVVATMQPTYLVTLAQIRKTGVRPVHPERAAWRTARLVCLELAELAQDHGRRLAEARSAASATAGCLASA